MTGERQLCRTRRLVYSSIWSSQCLSMTLNGFSTKLRHGLHPPRLQKVGLRDQPNSLIDAKLCIQADQVMRTCKQVRQHGQPKAR